MKGSRMDIWQQFLVLEKEHELLSLPKLLDAILDNCEYQIHIKANKNTKSAYKSKRRKHQLSQQYRSAFKTLSIDEKLSHYMKLMKIVMNCFDGKLNNPQPLKGMVETEIYSRSYNIKKWKNKKLRLNRAECVLYAERSQKIKTYRLEDYLLRRSKNTEYHSFVLEAINKNPHQKSRTVHLGFKTQDKLNQWLQELEEIFLFLQKKFVYNCIGEIDEIVKKKSGTEMISFNNEQKKQQESSSSSDDGSRLRNSQVFDPKPNEFQHSDDSDEPVKSTQSKEILEQIPQRKRQKTIIESLSYIEPDQIEEIQENDKEPTGDEREDIFHRIIPQYRLSQFTSLINYESISSGSDTLKLYSNSSQPTRIKFIQTIEDCPLAPSQIGIILSNTDLLKTLNPQIQEFALKTLIRSQNSALMYMKTKPYNRLYRPRDFLFLRHVFREEGDQKFSYIIDKSVENMNYPPFITIVRGQLVNLWGIRRKNKNIEIWGEIMMKNSGYLKEIQDINLTVKYLNGFKDFEASYKQVIAKGQNLKNMAIFNSDWNLRQNKVQDPIAEKSVNDNESKGSSFKKKTVKESASIKSQQKKQQSPLLKSNKVQKKPERQLEPKKVLIKMEQEGQIDAKQLEIQELHIQNTKINLHIDFDAKGRVIINKDFIKTKYMLRPSLPKPQIQYLQSKEGHPIWKGDWKHDDKLGGIIFINEKKIQDQKGVLKFILTKIGKNILSGKSVMNISLPVDIFSPQSNLELLLYSMTYAPIKIQPSCTMTLLERFKRIVAFGISNSPLYLNMQKPFNPILGETFQCFFNGCPGYAEQISHHPPIAALMFKGRGYEISAQLESKVELHMNSGCGTNQGIFRIRYSDGVQICYITPGGEVSGLTYGDRKFNMVGKSYYWTEGKDSEQTSIFLELVFNPSQKGFFSVGKQERPIDYFEGQVCKVKKDFIKQFLKKKGCPNGKEIVQKIGKIHGIWNQKSMFEDECILDIDKEAPAKLQYEANPLPSDANWREDIAYRRLLQITRAQTQKQRLEVLQRTDRKLRQKFNKKKV